MKHIDETYNNVDISYIPVNKQGFINLQILKEILLQRKHDTLLVSIMHANNEIGTIQDINKIGNLIKSINSSILFHTDACQSFGKIPISINYTSTIDYVTLNAHKLHGPKGIGAIYITNLNAYHHLICNNNSLDPYHDIYNIIGFKKCIEMINYNTLLSIRNKLYILLKIFFQIVYYMDQLF